MDFNGFSCLQINGGVSGSADATSQVQFRMTQDSQKIRSASWECVLCAHTLQVSTVS